MEVDLLILVPKIAQSARSLKSALALKHKQISKKDVKRNAVNQEERRKSIFEDAPLWEGKMMMQNLAKRVFENKARTTNERAKQQKQVEKIFKNKKCLSKL